MSDEDNSGPRTARGPAEVWTPAHADREASARIWRLTPLWRADAVRRASLELILKSSDPEVRAIGYLLHDAVADGAPERFARDAGLVIAGGHHSLDEQKGRSWRDAMLRQLIKREPYSGLSLRAAAHAVLEDFARYERRGWPRDRASGRLPQAGPTAVWSYLLARGIRMPSTVNGLVSVLKRETSSTV